MPNVIGLRISVEFALIAIRLYIVMNYKIKVSMNERLELVALEE